MSVTIVPPPSSRLLPVRLLRTGMWISENATGPWHRVWETGDTCLLVGDRLADATVVPVVDPDLPVHVLDAADAPRR